MQPLRLSSVRVFFAPCVEQYDIYYTSVNRFGETPLHMAVKAGSWETIKMLLFEGADPYATGNQGTPIDFSLRHWPKTNMHLLLKGIYIYSHLHIPS